MVLDTNAVLDWLVFADPAMQALGAAVQAAQVQWVACPRMREELAHMAGRTSLARWKPDSERTLAVFDRYAYLAPDPATAPLSSRCTDPDDQVFIDLALAAGARWLVTRDKALLKLARRCRGRGVTITLPANWQLA